MRCRNWFALTLTVWSCATTWLMAPATLGAAEEVQPPARAVRIRIEGMITPLTRHFAFERIERAREMGADLVIFDIDSPGGFVEPSLELMDRVRAIDWARTVAWVDRESLSGAAFLALACDEIVMHPSARLGDAGPIVLGDDMEFRHAPEKVVSDLAVRMRDLGQAKKRPPALLEAMVDRQVTVHHVRNKKSGENTFRSDAELADDPNPGDWEKVKVVFEAREGRFLEVTGARAVELQLAIGTAENFAQVKKRYRLEADPPLLAPNWVDVVVLILNHWLVSAILLVVGLVCLYIELHIPGFGIAGLASGLCFLLFFWARFLGGTAGWLEVLLFLGGMVCLAVEIFILPGFGVTGVTGILLVVTSLVLASQTFIVPQSDRDYRDLGKTLAVLAGVLLAFFSLAYSISRRLGAIPVLRGLVLTPSEGTSVSVADSSDAEPEADELSRLLEQTGVAETVLRPAGKASIGGEYFDVVAEGAFVQPGKPIRVVDVAGNRIVVREITETS